MTDNTGRDYIRAEDDDHTIHELPLPTGLLFADLPSDQKQRKDINLPFKGFKVESMLTVEECKKLVALAEKTGLKPVTWEYNPAYRSCTRLVVKMPELAAELWRRLRPHLHLEDITNSRPFGYGTSDIDVWRPYGINECIRFTKYIAKDKFARHRDGAFVLTDDERSVFTVMVYLNEASEYEGGETVFYSHDRDATHGDGFRPAATVSGSIGQGLVFQHNLWHEGKELVSGVKHILRTDLMFMRVAAGPLASAQQYLNKDEYQRAEALYQESIRLQKSGDASGSTAAYLTALDIHASLEVSNGSNFGSEYRMLPIDVMVEILCKLSFTDLFRVWCVSRGWRALARHPSLWKHRYRQYFGWSAPLEQASKRSVTTSSSAYKTPLKDWHTVFRTRWVAKRKFNVVFVDIGSHYVRFGMLAKPDNIIAEPSLVCKVSGHYWSAGSGLGQHACGWNGLNHCRLAAAYRFVKKSAMFIMEDVQILLRWILLEGFATVRLMPQEHPMLLARAPDMTDAMCTYLGDVLRNLLGVPCVAFVDQAICTLAALDCSTGLVLSIDKYVASVTAIVSEKVVSREHQVTEALHEVKIDANMIVACAPNDQPMWTRGVIGALCALTKRVLAQLSAEQKHELTLRCFLRGYYGKLVLDPLLVALSKETDGVITALDDRACHMLEEHPQKSRPDWQRRPRPYPVPTIDVVMGLRRLCSSVSRAQKFFASVEPPAIKFNRTLLIMVMRKFPGDLDYEWQDLQGWTGGRSYGNDQDILKLQQVKCITCVPELQEWWQAFAPQLEVAQSKGLVRLMWSHTDNQEDVKEYGTLMAWHKKLKNSTSLPLLIRSWSIFEKEDKHNIFWKRPYTDCKPSINAKDFYKSTAPHTMWQISLGALARIKKQGQP